MYLLDVFSIYFRKHCSNIFLLYAVFKVQVVNSNELLLTVSSHNIQENFFLYLITRNILVFLKSGSHLLSHAVSSIVPSAV